MKRILVTLCSLALVIAGTFGVNHLSANNANKASAASNTKNVTQYAEDADGQSSLPADKVTPAVNNNLNAVTAKAKAVTPVARNAAAAVNSNNNQASVQTSNKAASAVSDAQTTLQTSVNNQTDANTSNSPSLIPVSYTGANKMTANSNGQIYAYKVISSSNCKSAQDAAKALQQNGYNINNVNLQNVKSINDLLALIKQNGYGSGTKTTPAPTKAPAPTAKPTPAPTKAPAPTAKPTPAPTKAPAPTTAPSSGNSTLSSYASQVLQLINKERAKAGLSAYTTNSTIQAAANVRAKEIKQSFSHTRPDGQPFYSVLKQYGISYMTAGENIAYGQRTPQEVVTAWMNSAGHRANILNPNFHKIGIGVYQVNGVYYWSQEFTN